MKVFGIGLQKTGTTTLGRCLSTLGYNHCGYSRRGVWYLRNNKTNKLKKVMDKYESFEDEPWPHLYKLADKLYPDAKFILTTRKNPEKWFDSFCKHCDRIPFNEHRAYFYHGVIPRKHKESMINTYNQHNLEVVEYFKGREEKLLQISWENGDGWSELCVFLNKPVPENSIKKENSAPLKDYPILTYSRVIRYMPMYFIKVFFMDYVKPFITLLNKNKNSAD